MRRALCAAFFLSGAAALLFENLWFRGAHLALGNGVWAQSVVLASFMAGLALGASLATRTGSRTGPLRSYVRLELIVAVSGLALVVALPTMSCWLSPWLGPLYGQPIWLNAARLGVSFVLLVLPTTAMGMTLPLLARALAPTGAFGPNLGALYGWNTLGAVAGALGVEGLLVPTLGVRGSGLVAAALGLGAALVALLALRGSPLTDEGAATPEEGRTLGGGGLEPPGWETRRLLAVGALAGAVLLALEVVWFRFLAQYTDGTALSFAMLLAAVLLGIGGGGLMAGAVLRRKALEGACGAVLAGSVVFLVAQYAGFARWLPWLLDPGRPAAPRALGAALWLTFPSAFLSGALFTLLGSALQRRVPSAQRAAGLLVASNTAGALAGAVLGGFVLLPALGVERSLFGLALVYAASVLVLPSAERQPASRAGRLVAFGLGAAALLTLALFPFGLMDRLYVRAPLVRFGEGTILAVREGLTETAVLLEHRLRGRRHSLRLVTNGFSMTAATWNARRYMGLYADLPLALHERPRSALLVCYGIGVTARALVESPELERIDVVDVAPEAVALAEAASVDGRNPLRDPRVSVHIEDGRAFLALTRERYDVITAEPPPPTNAGIVSLYTREHFETVKSRLAEGGFVTYWLPVHTLDDAAAPAVIGAFCGAFPDCTLWSGADLDWMLVGTKDRRAPVSEARVRERWADSVRGPALREMGLESPEQMAALFLGDSARLRELAAPSPPLVDDRPGRIGRAARTLPTRFAYEVLFGGDRSAAFAASPEVARLWPEAIRSRARPAFADQDLLNRLLVARLGSRPPEEPWLQAAYTGSRARLPVLLWFGSDPDLQRVAREGAAAGEADAWIRRQQAIAALADRRPDLAVPPARASLDPADPRSTLLLAYALAQDGRLAEARAVPGLDGRSAAFLAEAFPAPPAGDRAER